MLLLPMTIIIINIDNILKSSNSLRIFTQTKFKFLTVVNHWITYILSLNICFLKFFLIFLPFNYLFIVILVKNVCPFKFFDEIFIIFFLTAFLLLFILSTISKIIMTLPLMFAVLVAMIAQFLVGFNTGDKILFG